MTPLRASLNMLLASVHDIGCIRMHMWKNCNQIVSALTLTCMQ